ncbi:MAG TPA: hypothetical protein VGK57_08450, partial [Candidatus Binatia bacterium]
MLFVILPSPFPYITSVIRGGSHGEFKTVVRFRLGRCAITGLGRTATAAPVDDLIAGAKKEGVIEFYGPSTLGPEGAKELAGAFNKKYGLNIKLN